MAGVHPMGDLAPRDVVAGAIDARMAQTGDPCVYLDARGIDGFEHRFPTVTAACRAAGIDPTREPIPGRAGCALQLWRRGDRRARTHRLGGPVRGRRGGAHRPARREPVGVQQSSGGPGGRRSSGQAAAAHAVDAGPSRAMLPSSSTRRALPRADLQRAMTRYASVVRDGDGLERLGEGTRHRHTASLKSRSDFEDVALTTTAGAVAVAALARTESRGLPSSLRLPGHRPGVGAQPGAGGGVLMELSADELTEARRVIARALEEDLRYGPDVTTLATVPADATTTASMVAREPGVIAGVDIALLVLDEVLGPGGYLVKHRVDDGARLESGGAVLTVEAPTQGLLTAERTTLNLVCHLSGIATTTAAWVAPSRARRPRFATPARRCRGCAHCRSMRCGSAAA